MSAHETIHIDVYERGWIVVSLVLLIAFGVAVGVAGFALGIQVPSPEQRVDPRTVATQGPWAEPGLRELAPGKYEAYILARTWQFIPDEVVVPVGSRVTFYVTSVDVVHGFKVQGTNLNVMVIPGQVSRLSVTFERPGEYPIVCTEYCGAGHAAMFAKVVVEP